MRGLGIRHGGQPVATIALCTASVAVFLVTHRLTRALAFTQGSLRFSALEGYSTFGPYIADFHEARELLTGAFLQTDWWRIFTGAFLHIDLRHLLFNMAVLFLLGRRLERFVGPYVLAGIYAVSLVGGSAGAMLHRPESAVVGHQARCTA